MKWLRRAGLAILSLPALLVFALIFFEIFGMCVNHAATGRQTRLLRQNLTREIPDIEILDIYSETGNTSGTGNHVDCLSVVTFSTGLTEDDVTAALSRCYPFDEWDCLVEQDDDGAFRFRLRTQAPFADNIEGH